MRLLPDFTTINHTVYVIQKWMQEYCPPYWMTVEPSARLFGELSRGDEDASTFAYAFSASGECWQKTGIHGVFDRQFAIQALCAIASQNTNGRRYRVVQQHWHVTQREVISM